MKNTGKRGMKWAWVFHGMPMASMGIVPERYVCVCEVGSIDPNRIFLLTNIHSEDDSLDWTDNRDVIVLSEPTRSTSAGDMFVTSEGRMWFVEACGFSVFDLDPNGHRAAECLVTIREQIRRTGRLDAPIAMRIKKPD